MRKHWKVQSPDLKTQNALVDTLGVDPIVARLLHNRGIVKSDEAREFLFAELSGLHDPFLMKNMRKAVDRIKQASARNERVLVFGDYDVDGVTSSVLLRKALTKMGIDVVNHIPHRMVEGYGLNEKIVEVAKEQGICLLITVDCGTTSFKEVDALNAQGIDVIILDHHEPSTEVDGVPDAHAIINPKQKDCTYPFKQLAAVGLVAKLIHALEGELHCDVLDLAALGTVADIVPLHGENRIIVKAGLANISKTNNKGLSALLDIGKIRNKVITPFHVGFVLGPRINAAGRMDSAHTSLDLFLTEDEQEAKRLAKELDKYNVARKKVQNTIAQEALAIIEQEVNFKEQKIIVVAQEGWHKGVLGIVASKIVNEYYRPAIVISIEEGVGTASARSIEGFHLHRALEHCSDYLERFGGHRAAAGLTIRQENIDAFRDRINAFACDMLTPEKLFPSLSIDCQITLSSINMTLAQAIESMQPFGEGNPKPVFCSRQVTAIGAPSILGKGTIKFWVTDGDQTISAVGFGMAEYKAMVSSGHKLDLAYEISIDDWNKAPTPQLMLKDIQLSE